MNTNVQNFLFGTMMTVVVVAILQSFEVETTWPIILGVFLFSYPWKMPNGDVYSLWGGVSQGDIYSLFGVYQNAACDAGSLVGILVYQKGNDTTQVLGVSFCQLAKKNAGQWIGVSCFQKGGNAARQGLGVVFCQIAEHYQAEQVWGVIIYQQGGETAAQTFGIPLWQKVIPPSISDKHAMR